MMADCCDSIHDGRTSVSKEQIGLIEDLDAGVTMEYLPLASCCPSWPSHERVLPSNIFK